MKYQTASSISCRVGNLFLVVIALASQGVLANVDQSTCLLIRNAKIHFPSTTEEEDFGHANFGHQIGPGTLNVLSVRNFEKKSDGDSSTFLKITAELGPIPKGLPIGKSIKVDVTHSFYTVGSVAFFSQGEYYWASDPLREVRVTHDLNGLSVAIDAAFISVRGRAGWKHSKSLHFACSLKDVALRDVGPWDGNGNTTWNSFSPPKK